MTEPRWLTLARGLLGIKEVPGAGDSGTILSWAKKLGGWVASFYRHDSTPWCGLFVGYVFSQIGIQGPQNPLGALQWSSWGEKLNTPWLGCVMTFRRPGGGHVGFYVGEDATAYHILGGNQSDTVSITRIDKKRLDAIRWPTGQVLGSVGRVDLRADGKPVSRDER